MQVLASCYPRSKIIEIAKKQEEDNNKATNLTNYKDDKTEQDYFDDIRKQIDAVMDLADLDQVDNDFEKEQSFKLLPPIDAAAETVIEVCDNVASKEPNGDPYEDSEDEDVLIGEVATGGLSLSSILSESHKEQVKATSEKEDHVKEIGESSYNYSQEQEEDDDNFHHSDEDDEVEVTTTIFSKQNCTKKITKEQEEELQDKQWKANFDLLKKYTLTHSICNLKQSENKKLYDWIYHQRRGFKNLRGKKYTTRMQNRYNLLKSIGFEFNPGEGRQEEFNWKNKFDQLKRYKKIHGHCNVKSGQDHSLYSWVNDQCRKFKGDGLTRERLDLLKSVGFVFEKDGRRQQEILDIQWRAKFEQLKVYKLVHGHCVVKCRENKKLYY